MVAVGGVVAVETAVSTTTAVAEAIATGWTGKAVAGGSVGRETAVEEIDGVGKTVGVEETAVDSGLEQAINKKIKSKRIYLFM